MFFIGGCAAYTPQQTSTQSVLTLSASSLDFKSVVLGHTVTQTPHVANMGKAPVEISGLSVSEKQFEISGPSVPRVILPGLVLTYSVSFTPAAAGSASGSLSILTKTSNVPAKVSLAGVGEKVIGAVELTPVSINFGNLVLNTTATQSVSLKNTSDINLVINGVTVVGSGFGYSDLSPGFSLPPNQKVTFKVWFRPQTKGVSSGTISILSANLVSPATIAATGNGVTSATTAVPPATPSAVQHTVHLSWYPSTSSVVGYKVYRSTVSGSFGDSLFSSPVDALTYDDSTVASGTTYYYSVTAVDRNGAESAHSDPATVAVPTP